ncbi:50S ribosomal protein L25 [Candidatus Nomurabacteria bacterium]|nr:50S ribosomal protein L25 [Candidatus Nomurabacteria bacterium]
MLKIAAEERSIFGKKLKESRIAGKLPVVVYGERKKDALPLFVTSKDFKKLLKEAGESTVVTVDAGTVKKDVLIHDVDWHPVSGEPLHADFYVVDKTKTIEIGVPLVFSGVAPAVKELGGILVKVLHELNIEVLPMNIPHDITVDISALTNLDSQILVKDLLVPTGIKVINQADEVVAAVSVAKEEPVEEVVSDLSAIEVEKKGKKETEDDGASGSGAEEKADSKN